MVVIDFYQWEKLSAQHTDQTVIYIQILRREPRNVVEQS